MKMFFGGIVGITVLHKCFWIRLASFETLITNSRFTFMKMYKSCSNELVAYMRVLDI